MSHTLSLQAHVNRDTLEEIAKLGLAPDEQMQLIRSLLTPQEKYYLRVNLTKILKDELIRRLHAKNVAIMNIPAFPETVGVKILSKSIPPPRSRVVHAYKYAAESVFTGAHLYYPGVGPNSHVPLGMQVEIRDWERKIHIASGITRMNLKKPPARTGVAVENTHSPFAMWPFHESEEYATGLIDDQSLPPVAVAHVLMSEYKQGFKILDLCAAPGGKTAAIAQIGKLKIGEWPDIRAIDRSQNRLVRLEEKIIRLGLGGIQSQRLKLEKIHTEHPEWKEQSDLVLIDPPCSALGTRPKIYIDTPANYYHDFAENQFRLLQHAWELVKPGGVLVYSTCTITKAENEGNVARVLEKFDAQLLPSSIDAGHPGIHSDTLSGAELFKVRRFWPHLDDCIGYFIAKFRRVS
jgi:16S rRNA C967 or C1407 C5-methylase (RsmB/RsmF family)